MKNSAAPALPSGKSQTITSSLPGAGTDILVVTEDDLFLLDVRGVVKLPNRVWHATSDLQAADMLMKSPCAVALFDLALVQSRLASVVSSLRQQFPDLSFVAAGEPLDQLRVAGLIEQGRLQGFIVKARTAESLVQALQTGVNRHLDLKSAAQARQNAAGRRNMPLFAGIAGAIAVTAFAAWLLTRGAANDTGSSDSLATDTAANGTTGLDASGTVELELQKANEAFEAGRYTRPKGASALDLYQAALAADPGNAEARDGVHRVAEVMLARAEAALLEGKPAAADEAIKESRAIEPDHPRIAFLESQVARELDRSVAAQQEAARADATSQKLANLIKLGNERLSQDRLVEPKGDDARTYFTAARALDSAGLLAQQGLRSLANRMIEKSGEEAARGDATASEKWLAQARQLGVSGVDLAKAEREVRSAGQRARSEEADRLAGLARERIASGSLLSPESDSALFYVRTLKAKFPSHAGLGPIVDSLETQLLKGAEDAASRKDVGVAQRMLEEAGNLGASGAGLEAATAAVASARRKAAALAVPTAVRSDMIVRSNKPDYPQRAARDKVEGFVDLQLTVNSAGEVVDVSVVKAEPLDMFEEAATHSVRRWKFRPLVIDGESVDQRLALRMRFKWEE